MPKSLIGLHADELDLEIRFGVQKLNLIFTRTIWSVRGQSHFHSSQFRVQEFLKFASKLRF